MYQVFVRDGKVADLAEKLAETMGAKAQISVVTLIETNDELLNKVALALGGFVPQGTAEAAEAAPLARQKPGPKPGRKSKKAAEASAPAAETIGYLPGD
jgi:hypothetical protein